jgi:hypothetical protein
MDVIKTVRFVDALADWGRHEWQTRHRRPDPIDEGHAIAAALQDRAPLVSRLLLADPTEVLRVVCDAEEAREWLLADAQTVEQWKKSTESNAAADASPNAIESWDHYQRLLSGDRPIVGRLLLVAKWAEPGKVLEGPVVVFDGYHRVAALDELCRRGSRRPIEANLVITNVEPLEGVRAP